MTLLWHDLILLGKVESAYASDASPGAADAILARELRLDVEQEVRERDLHGPTLGRRGALTALPRCRVRVEVEFAGSGTAGTPPAWGPLMRACAMAETVTAGTKVDYAPVSDAFESVTLYWWAGGTIRHRVLGARGSWSLAVRAGDVPVLRFDLTGLYENPADTTPPTPDFAGWKIPKIPAQFTTPTLSLHGVDLVASSLEVDIGAQVVPRNMIGRRDVIITGRRPRATLLAETTPTAVKNWFAAAAANEQGALLLQHGTSAGNIVEVTAPAAQPVDVRYEERDGVVMTALELLLNEVSGDDEIVVTAR